MGTVIRPAVAEDVERIIDVCDQAWNGIWKGYRNIFLDRIKTFPHCGIVVGEIDGVIEGYISAQIAGDDAILCPNWNQATDFGSFKKTHNPNGEWLHGAGLAVTPNGSRGKLTVGLISYLYNYAKDHGKLGGRFVTRIPGYHKFRKELTPEVYVNTFRDGKYIDPELRVMQRYGFHVVQPPVVFDSYVEGGGDPNSCGYGVLIEILVADGLDHRVHQQEATDVPSVF